jgi:hypothetical protein
MVNALYFVLWVMGAAVSLVAMGVIAAYIAWCRFEYSSFVRRNSVGYVKRTGFGSGLAQSLAAGCAEGGFDGSWGQVVPESDPLPIPRPTPMRRLAIEAGQELRVHLKCPRYTTADWKVAVERATKHFDEHRVAENWRQAHKVAFVNVCAASILTPSNAEIEAKEALCSVELLGRRNAALDARVVDMPWYLRIYALCAGKEGVIRVGAENPKPLA